MAGCKKADRNRKSKQGLSYKSATKWLINKKRRIERAEKVQLKKQERIAKDKVTKRGLARHKRRATLRALYEVKGG